MAFEPITRLEKILTGEEATPYTRLEKAVKIAVDNAGSGGGGAEDFIVTATLGMDGNNPTITAPSKSVVEIHAAYSAGKKVHLVMDGDALASGMDIDIPLTQIVGDSLAVFGGNISGNGMATGLVLVMWDGNDAGISLYIPQGNESNDYIVTITASGTTPVVDKSIADIYTAAAAGKHVFAEYAVAGMGTQLFELGTYSNETIEFYNNQVHYSGETATVKPVVIYGIVNAGSDEWTVVE